jgi:hypothetical protein
MSEDDGKSTEGKDSPSDKSKLPVDDDMPLLAQEFGKEAPVAVTRGKIHEYLDIRLDLSIPGELVVPWNHARRHARTSVWQSGESCCITPFQHLHH